MTSFKVRYFTDINTPSSPIWNAGFIKGYAITDPPYANNSVISFNSALNVWTVTAGRGGADATALQGIPITTDAIVPVVQNGQFLVYDSSVLPDGEWAVQPTIAPSDGQILAYNSTSGEWEAISESSDATALRGVTIETAAATPSDGQILAYNSTSGEWELTTNASSGDATALRGVTIETGAATPSNGQILMYNSTSGEWELTSGSSGDATALRGVTIETGAATPSDGQILVYNSTSGEWELGVGGESNTASSSGGTSLVLPKSGVNLPFKGLTATSTKIGLTSNATDIGIDVNEANLTLSNLGGTLGVSQGGTGATTLTSGNILQGNGTGAVTDTLAAPSGAIVGTTDTQTLSNKTISIVNGTASVPSLSFTSDPNTGIYSPGADQFGISIGGTRRINVNTTRVQFDTYTYNQSSTLSNPSITFTNNPTKGIYSVDSNHVWTARTSSQAESNNWNDMIYAPELDLFVAVGFLDKTITSSNGIDWTQTDGVGFFSVRSILWVSSYSLFITVGGNQIYTSVNGTSWDVRTSPADVDWAALEHAPALSLTVGLASGGVGSSNRIMTSSNGTSWTLQSSAIGNGWSSLAWSESLGLFVAVRGPSGQNTIATSTNGTTWSILGSSDFGISFFSNTIVWAEELGLFVAAGRGDGGETRSVITSPDGTNWTIRDTPDNGWSSIIWSSETGLLMVTGSNSGGSSAANRVMYSYNGIDWVLGTAASSNTWTSLAYSPILNRFVSLGFTIVVGGSLMTLDYSNELGLTVGGGEDISIELSGITMSNDLTIDSGIKYTFLTDATDSVSLDTTQNIVELSNTGTVTVTLPDASSIHNGRRYHLIKTGNGGVVNINTFDANDHIDGDVLTTISLSTQFDRITLICNGMNRWYTF